MSSINYSHVVVGTGPSAVAAIQVLINHGIVPLVVDVGYTPTKHPGFKRSKLKTWFGSTETYKQTEYDKSFFSKEIAARPSYGFGGYSRVWGATCDFDQRHTNWSSTCIPSKKDYDLVRSILRPVKFPFQNDALSKSFQGLTTRLQHLKFEVIDPTLAIETDSYSKNKCEKSGTCLTGCPSDSIWFSGNLIKKWVMSQLIDYRKNIYVKTIKSLKDHVEISVVVENKIENISAKKVFLATGPLSTARILVESKVINELVIQDTPTYFIAGLTLSKKYSQEDDNITLSKFWIRSRVPDQFLLQVYAAGRGNIDRIRNYIPSFLGNLNLLETICNFLVPMIVYCKEIPSVKVYSVKNSNTVVFSKLKAAKSGTDLKKLLMEIRFLFLSQMIFIPWHKLFVSRKVLGGYHFGGSIKHGHLTDDVGQLPNLPNVFIVDASVLPSIAPGSIVATTMANSVRIVRTVIS